MEETPSNSKGVEDKLEEVSKKDQSDAAMVEKDKYDWGTSHWKCCRKPSQLIQLTNILRKLWKKFKMIILLNKT